MSSALTRRHLVVSTSMGARPTGSGETETHWLLVVRTGLIVSTAAVVLRHFDVLVVTGSMTIISGVTCLQIEETSSIVETVMFSESV